MVKRCSKCKRLMGLFSKVYTIDDRLYCRKCAKEIASAKALEKTLGWYSQEDVYYSGLIVENGVKTNLALKPIATKEEIESNLKKINDLPPEIKCKILEVPQIKIFFEEDIPYYITKNDSSPKRLPIHESFGRYLFYDPIEDTEAYKMVIKDVVEIANKRYHEHMAKHFTSEYIT